MSDPAVVLRDVFCVHRTEQGDAAALQGLSLTVARGEQVCVLGPSGAGKTTVLRVIAGLQPPSAGAALLFGRDVGRLAARERARLRSRTVGFMAQRAEATLSPELPIAQAVGLPLALRGAGRRSRERRAGELLEAVGLRGRGKALPGELSGGERQRVALCAALAHRPALLLADEPTAELDGAAADTVAALIGALAQVSETTVVVVSHDPAMAARARRTVQIRDGRIASDHRDGETSLIVGRGGWLRLDTELLGRAGIDREAWVEVVTGGLLVSPARGQSATAPDIAPDIARVVETAPAGRAPVRVELHGVSRARGQGPSRRIVIDGLTLAFEPGRLTALTGRSGSGKTSLLELLACLESPDGGELWLDGHSTAAAGPERRAALRRSLIGYLPQEPAPIAFLSGEENLALALRVRGVGPMEARRRAGAMLGRLGLAERAGQRVARLSAGEAQRVALARALVCARGLLIADEPTSRLDSANAGTVARLLAQTASSGGQTVICATHDPELIALAGAVVSLGR